VCFLYIIPFLVERNSPYKRRHFENRSDWKSVRSDVLYLATFANNADVVWSFSVILSCVLSFCKHNWRTLKWTSTKLGTGKRWPPRSGWLLVVIRICAWILVFHFLCHWGMGHFLTFVSISLFSQFSYNQLPIWTKLGEMNDADECIHNFGTDIRRTFGSRLIRKCEFESASLSFQILASAEVCNFALSITDRTSLISKIQNVWSDRFSKRRRL